MTNTEIIDCTTCKYGYEDERLCIPMCHHPKRFSEDCVDFNMHEEKEIQESEKPMNQDVLEEEIKNYFQGYWPGTETAEQCNIDLHFTPPAIMRLARHFYELGCRRTAEKYDEIEYNRQRAEENEKPSVKDAMKELNEKIALVKERGTWEGVDVDSYMDEVRERVSDDLEEAADNHIREVVDAAGHPGWEWETRDIKDAFIAGAKWQAEKDTRNMYMSDNRHFNKVYELGKKDMKEQMLKEAVDADVLLTLHDKTGDISLHTGYLPKELGIKYGDKVKIIIVKE